MKIESSNVSMMSERQYSQYTLNTTVSAIKISGQKGNSLGFFQNYLNQPLKSSQITASGAVDTGSMSLTLMLLHRIFDSIAGRRALSGSDLNAVQKSSLLDLRSTSSASSVSDLTVGSVWQRSVTTQTLYYESETTTFSSTGYAKTSDGRTISFNVDLSMSRAFTDVYESYQTAEYIVTDPLVIDIGSSGISVSDQKFLFDLDCDGEKENISFAGNGNGFLALDKNGDGKINDGSELFGTRSGDGFADLKAYDSDNNGWIDESDDIYSRLRVWTKDEYGKDKLIDLKSADVGAIYLGHTSTEYALTDSSNNADAFIRSTGIYLKESGGSGTISQLDLTS